MLVALQCRSKHIDGEQKVNSGRTWITIGNARLKASMTLLLKLFKKDGMLLEQAS
jgi:hypothetical protein